MTSTTARPEHQSPPLRQTDIVTAVRRAGVAGAGGAGFPTYSKWERVDDADYLLVNHQESEPNYHIDKWLGQEYATEFAALFDSLLEELFEVVVVSAKWKDRAPLRELETLTDGTVRRPEQLPLDPADESGVVFAYTGNTYQYGMESVLLNVVAETVIGDDLPMEYGWVVQNTETLHNIYRAWTAGTPVTTTYVHVDGAVSEHRFLEVPLGTPVRDVVAQADDSGTERPPDTVVAHGGPGWCFPVDGSPATFGVRKHTNCLLVLDSETVEEHTLGGDRIDVLEPYDWTGYQQETEPTETLEPAIVHIPFVNNAGLRGVVQPGDPVVSVGDTVETGDRVAAPSTDGISIPQHASIDGTVTAIDETAITIHADGTQRATQQSTDAS